MSTTAVKITIKGRVQGVGFRPFVYQLAMKKQIVGTVQNNMDGVHIHAQGLHKNVQSFMKELLTTAPTASDIHVLESVEEEVSATHTTFSIVASDDCGKSQLIIPIDSAVCQKCVDEMNDQENARYRYPFINCTQCGPRYTIIDALPYDRSYTSMKQFPMCSMCRQEYENVENRRHHAQPIACESCGPTVSLLESNGREVTTNDPILQTIGLLKKGYIVAIKGIGGYHLCCDATNETVVNRLRIRKKRPHRPLALMVSSISEINNICFFNKKEKKILESREAPIVILKRRPESTIATNVAPKMQTIGVMLPYTPLHYLLLEDPCLSTIVFTSANLSGQPLLYRDEEVVSDMMGITDYLLTHNREIIHPVDDSVLQINAVGIDFLRRSRGFAPDPLSTKKDVANIVAFGGQQKATFAIGSNQQVFVSPHIGDMENVETMDHYATTLTHLLKWVTIKQEIAVVDAHPDFHVRHLLKELSFEKVIEVQHHHAHMVACMEENELTENVWGIILDGTGYGDDSNIWGFEMFYGDATSFRRMAHLRYTPLPGGEKAIKEPWRNGAAMLIDLLEEEGVQFALQLFPNKEKELLFINNMLKKQFNLVQAGSCGRLFDAVSAICGICHQSTYDGEAAILLGELAELSDEVIPYSYTVLSDSPCTIDFSAMLKEIVTDVLHKVDVTIISSRFHETIVQSLCETLLLLKKRNQDYSKKVVFSGGSFHNRFIRTRLTEILTEKGFQVYNHHKIPCNDGGLSYGQLFIATAKRKAGMI